MQAYKKSALTTTTDFARLDTDSVRPINGKNVHWQPYEYGGRQGTRGEQAVLAYIQFKACQWLLPHSTGLGESLAAGASWEAQSRGDQWHRGECC